MKEQPKSVKDALRQIRQFGLDILAKSEMAQLAESIVAKHKDKFKTLEVSIGYQYGSIQGVLIKAHDVESMRDVLPIIRELRWHGFKVKSHEDYPEAKRRTYDMGDIKVLVFLPWDEGSTCKYVKVGMKEEPQYKLQCDGETFAEEVTA